MIGCWSRGMKSALMALGASALLLSAGPASISGQRGSEAPKPQPRRVFAPGSSPATISEILGRPTDRSVTANALSDEDVDVFYEYGTQPGIYSGKTQTARHPGGKPTESVIDGLQPDTRYYYRPRTRRPGEAEFTAGEERSFVTQRARGRTFRFDVEADPHLDENSDPDLFRRTLQNILEDDPDFLIDLGDTFFSEKLPVVNEATVLARHLYLRTFFDKTSPSVPLFLALGNHEGELGSLLNGTANNLAVWAARARILHFPNPLPDGFYSGDLAPAPFVGLRQNYYSWEWGDALFVVLDPYWYTTVKSATDNWTVTLGAAQYLWLKSVLENSSARFKFVFCHQLVGGDGKDGRGGAEAARYFEWGGSNADGSWGFGDRRAGWDRPVHRLLVENRATIFFHGHDHFFAKQDLDGIVYQLVPQPGHPGTGNATQAASYGYQSGIFFPSSGHLRITVSGDHLTVEYIRAFRPQDENQGHINGELAYSYSIPAAAKKGGIRR